MKHAVLPRLALAMLVPVAIGISACDTGKNPAGLFAGGPNAGSDDQGGSTRTPTPADSFTLTVHVGSGISITDTVHSVPVAGATVALSKTVWKFITHGTGADTVAGTEVQVASGTTDANGDVRFEKLSLDLYRIQADGPADSGLESRWVKAELVHVANVRVPLILTRAP